MSHDCHNMCNTALTCLCLTASCKVVGVTGAVACLTYMCICQVVQSDCETGVRFLPCMPSTAWGRLTIISPVLSLASALKKGSTACSLSLADLLLTLTMLMHSSLRNTAAGSCDDNGDGDGRNVHAGLSTYPLYAMGGGYVISADVVETLVDVNRRLKLKFTPIEDATLGFWLMSMDLRHIDHHRFYTWAAPCCFKAPMRRDGQRIITR